MFKLMDLTNSAHGYHEYDLIARRLFVWGYIYPFIEAALGILYILNTNTPLLHAMTFVLSVLVA